MCHSPFCCTHCSMFFAADWFTEWPAEALKGVAMAMMTETDLELGGALEGIVEMFRCPFGSYFLTEHRVFQGRQSSLCESMRKMSCAMITIYLHVLHGCI